jgi:outer membrane protein assembly factor BamA
LRGYQDGFLNGSSYLIYNEEFRLPIYNTFFKKNIKSGFIKNLQFILFADFGTAWKGFYPTAKNVVSQSIYGSADKGVLVYIDNSFALGYGTGIRTKILGYFIRTDFAWRVNGGKKPMLHFSLATDF